jgi:pimeloyl-ACP methyl ester carboxylesterase
MTQMSDNDQVLDPAAFGLWVGEYAGGSRRLVLAMFADVDFGAPYAFYLEGDDVVRIRPRDAAHMHSDRGETFELVDAADGQRRTVKVWVAGADPLPVTLVRTASPVEEKVWIGPSLAGTLLLPEGSGPHTAVVLAHAAAGGQRDFYRLFAHTLVRANVAALIYDKPGFGESTANGSPTIFTQADAVEAALDYLRGRSDIHRVGLWGFSNGMWAVPMVAARRTEVAFVAGVGSPGVSMAVSESHRRTAVLRDAGVRHDVVESVGLAWRLILTAIGAGQLDEQAGHTLDELLRRLAAEPQLARFPLPAYARINPTLSPIPPPTVDAVRAYLNGTPDPELDHDPAADYQQIHCPVFLQYGANDVNVPALESENRIRGALERAGNRDVTISTYPDAGHMLGVSPAITGNSANEPSAEEAEYLMLHFTFTAGAREDLQSWMLNL